MMKKTWLFFALTLILIALLSMSCRQNKFFDGSDGHVNFSTDTVFFDTVFTSLGTATRLVMIRNPYNENLEIDKIWLDGHQDKVFRMNVDGISANEVEDIIIPPNDSIFIFVEATINPSDLNLPFVVSDSIMISTKGNVQSVKLVAWGQNAHYYRPTQQISGLPAFSQLSEYGVSSNDITWTNDKPYVIYGYLLIDSLLTLNIEEGAQIHMHPGAGIWVYRGGALNLQGEADNPIVIQGDRIEENYNDNAGQWDRIWINLDQKDQIINHTIIKNGFVGLQIEPYPFSLNQSRPAAKVEITNSIIQNMVGIGLFTRNINLTATNSVIGNCGTHLLGLTGGGNYSFTHCTFSNYWSGTRKDPSLLMTNYYEDLFGNDHYDNMDQAYFGNSIIYGNSDEEIGFDFDAKYNYSYLFEHSILRTKTDFDAAYVNNIYEPENTLVVDGEIRSSIFKDPSEFNYSLHEFSVARNIGDINVMGTLIEDIVSTPRSDGQPDVGAYEYKKD